MKIFDFLLDIDDCVHNGERCGGAGSGGNAAANGKCCAQPDFYSFLSSLLEMS